MLISKNTYTGKCMHFCRNTPWNIRTAWIKALYKEATKVCRNKKI